jgi:hypothetical protein
MATNLALRAKWEPLRSLAFGSISGTYAGIGTSFANPVRIMWIQNTTDVMLTFSQDGLVDNFVVQSDSFVLLDVTTNQSIPAGAFYFPEGERIYVKGSPTMGSVYLSIIYGTTIS